MSPTVSASLAPTTRPTTTATAIVVAAGGSQRMGGKDKLLAPLVGRPLLAHTLQAFEECAAIDAVVVVLSRTNAPALLPLLRAFGKVRRTAMGGDRRQDSVRGGLNSLPAADWVVVHDGARPFVTPGLIAQGIEAARRTGAAAAALPIVDTLKAARVDGTVIRTVPREGLWAIQTPQVFRHDLLALAHERITEDVTDDCAMVEQTGVTVRLFEGSRLNFKVTTPDDLRLAEAVARLRSGEPQPATPPAARARARPRRPDAG